jgi:hypothetical protein
MISVVISPPYDYHGQTGFRHRSALPQQLRVGTQSPVMHAREAPSLQISTVHFGPLVLSV